MKKNILITGSSGYIGRHLVKFLLSRGYNVEGLDINLANNNITTHLIDITGKDFKIVKKYDTVVHLAALMQVGESVSIPHRYYDTNLNGTYNVMNNLLYDNFVFASTGSATVPNNPYSISKLAAEHVVEEYCKNNNKPFTMFRFYNVLGTEDGIYPTNPDGLMVRLMEAVNTNIFCVYGNDYNTPDGSPVRDYLHVMDICRAIELSIREPANSLENLGTGVGHTVKEIAMAFIEANGTPFTLVDRPRRPGDAEKTVLNNPSRYMHNTYKLEELVKI